MRLTRLEIQTLPGIEPGFAITDFGPGLNLVTGPNGSGKSSLIRALQALVVEPGPDDHFAIAVAASFSGDGQWTVRRTGQQQVWELDGRPAHSPRLPRRDVLRCYWLTMEDLLVADERDDRLGAELRRSLAGGYDLVALRNEEQFRVGKQNGVREAKALREAQAEQRRVEAEYADLYRQEAQLPELDEQIDAARRAAGRSEQLRQALALLQARRRRQQVEAVLADFATGLERLRGDEMERLNKLEQRRLNLEHELRRQGERREQARDQLAAAGFGDTPRPQAVELDSARDELEEARRAQEQLDQEQRQLERARASEQRARAELAGTANTEQSNPEPANLISPQALHEAESLARRLQRCQAQQADLQGKLEGMPAATFATSHVELYWQAAHALRVWLAVGGFDARLLYAVLALALAGCGAAGVGAYQVEDWIALGGSVLAGLGIAAAGWLAPSDDRRAAQQRFSETGLQAPSRWRADAVRERLQELETARADLQRRQADAERAAELRNALQQVDKELAELEAERHELGHRLGFDPQLTAAALDRFVRLSEQLDRARDEGAAAQENCRRLEKTLEKSLARVRQHLAASGVECSAATGGLVELESALHELRERSRRAESAERDYHQAHSEQQRLQRELDELASERGQLFEQAGLEEDQRDELARRCEQHPAWREQRDRLREAAAVEAERRSALASDEQLLSRVDSGDEQGLQADLEQAENEAAELENLRDQASTIRTRLHDAGRDWRLEQAMAATESRQAALHERFAEGLFAEAAQVLLDNVEREHRQHHEPQVLSDARDRFRRFTRHNYDLCLGEDFTFFARDLSQQVDRDLGELSTGTRMQLLLAVRLAWADQLEQDRESLPLFLDEALTASDEERFVLIGATLGQMAREEGRQVFYLSARRHELPLWQRAVGELPHVIDLAQIRFGAASDSAQVDFALPERDPVPAPGEQEPAYDYAQRIGVPAIAPRAPAGSMHIFHLLRDDLPLLHRLLEDWRTMTLGQFEGLLDSSAAPAVIAAQTERQRLRGRCSVARLWLNAWRYGRGTPVDRTVLERSAAVSATFIDRVAELCDGLSGDGEALIEALRNGEVRRFQSSKIDELAQWLEDEGYIDPATPLDAEARERQVVQDAAMIASVDEIRRVVAWLEAGLADA
ncbi:AAA family ATPase [Halorhodospira halochloris]|uniref:AAA family ATPase n=1 Tax=Halorhodospira halochloris TaxID=1052 RepID=UPI001EE84699|nr:AAA family ATPase [Halorhodospira halochloris]